MGYAVGVGTGVLGGVVGAGGCDGHGSSLCLFGECDELGEHDFTGGAGELIDVGRGEVLSGDRVENCRLLVTLNNETLL